MKNRRAPPHEREQHFITLSTAKFNDKFDYSLVKYTNNHTPVNIICPIHGEDMKECKCSFHRGPNPLPIHQFGKNKRMVDGLHYWCKMCCSRYYNEKIYPSRKQRSKETVRLWQANNKDKVNETSRKYRARNKEKRRETTKRWRDKNKPTTRHLANQRRANKVQATPKWADGNRIREIYETCPPNHHVHHIVPLRERNDVCGLHCEDNLIILSASEHKAIHADQTALEESWYSYPPPTR